MAILQADDQGSKCKDYNLFLRTYDWDGSDWVQRGGDIKDITDGPANRDDGKIAISGDGNVIAIVDLHAEVNGQNTGSVRIYKWE